SGSIGPVILAVCVLAEDRIRWGRLRSRDLVVADGCQELAAEAAATRAGRSRQRGSRKEEARASLRGLSLIPFPSPAGGRRALVSGWSRLRSVRRGVAR